MDKRRKILGPTVGLCLFGLLTAQPCCASQTQGSLRAVALAVLRDVGSGNLTSFDAFASEGGIIVARRSVDWNLTKQEGGNEPVRRVFADDLDLSGLPSLVWIERVVDFNRADLEESDFRAVFDQFKGLIRNTRDGYSSSIRCSYHLRDDWNTRNLGTAIQGKIASNSFWYIYLDREHGAWKVWRMEYVVH